MDALRKWRAKRNVSVAVVVVIVAAADDSMLHLQSPASTYATPPESSQPT